MHMLRLFGLIYGFLSLCTYLQAQTASLSEHPALKIRSNQSFLQIIQQPADITVCEGGNAQFSVKVQTDGNPGFQWQSSVDKGVYWSDIPGANTSIYADLRGLSKVYDGLCLRVKVILPEGGEHISNLAFLTVDGNLTCLKPPQSQLIVEGGTLHLEAEFSSKYTPYFQWQYSPYATGTWLDLPGENRAWLDLHQMGAEQSGSKFRVIARGDAGCNSATSEPAFIEVISKPTIQLNKGQQTYCGGGSTTFTVKMKGGSGREKIQWQCSTDNGKSFRNVPKATETSYSLNRITEDMAGNKYRAVVTLPGSIELITTDITITVHGAVAFSEHPRSQKLCSGDEIVLIAKTDTRGSEPEYQWQMSKDSVHFTDLPDKRSAKLILPTNTDDTQPIFYRVVVNAGACQSMISDIAKIEFMSADLKMPELSTEPVGPGTSLAEISANLDADPAIFSSTWQWSANDGATWQTIKSDIAGRLVLTNVRQEVEGAYVYRLKILNKVCGRIYYSEPVGLKFTN